MRSSSSKTLKKRECVIDHKKLQTTEDNTDLTWFFKKAVWQVNCLFKEENIDQHKASSKRRYRNSFWEMMSAAWLQEKTNHHKGKSKNAENVSKWYDKKKLNRKFLLENPSSQLSLFWVVHPLGNHCRLNMLWPWSQHIESAMAKNACMENVPNAEAMSINSTVTMMLRLLWDLFSGQLNWEKGGRKTKKVRKNHNQSEWLGKIRWRVL